jgi:hypothetical protein
MRNHRTAYVIGVVLGLILALWITAFAADAPVLSRDELLMQKGAYLQLLQTQQNEVQQKIADIDAKIAALDGQTKAPADKKTVDVKK